MQKYFLRLNHRKSVQRGLCSILYIQWDTLDHYSGVSTYTAGSVLYIVHAIEMLGLLRIL